VYLATRGFSATAVDPHVLEVANASTDIVGDVAAANGITIHELSLQQVTLEEAFMELTHDSVEYRTDSSAAHSSHDQLLTQESVA
jgi:ABC-2 type transport system ATP-binding protein